jgi:DNA polymerase-3 subunit chi
MKIKQALILKNKFMTNIDFYLIPEKNLSESYRFICRLIDKAYQQKRKVYVHTNSLDESKIIDDLLWTFRDDAFVPHNIFSNNLISIAPIQIGHEIIPDNFNDILLNLTKIFPQDFTQFQRVLEIVPNNEDDKKISRQKYRLYQEKNCEIKSHDLVNV